MVGADPFDVVHSQLVVVWGANPVDLEHHFPPLVQQARGSGAALVVVDPRRTGDGQRADLHLAVRPGTDVVAGHGSGRASSSGARRSSTAPSPMPTPTGWTSTSRPASRGRWRRGRGVRCRRGPTSSRSSTLLARSAAGVLAHRVGHGAQPQRRLGRAGGVRPARADRAFGRARARACTCTPITICRGARRPGDAVSGQTGAAGSEARARPPSGREPEPAGPPAHRSGRRAPIACWWCRAPTRRS